MIVKINSFLPVPLANAPILSPHHHSAPGVSWHLNSDAFKVRDSCVERDNRVHVTELHLVLDAGTLCCVSGAPCVLEGAMCARHHP